MAAAVAAAVGTTTITRDQVSTRMPSTKTTICSLPSFRTARQLARASRPMATPAQTFKNNQITIRHQSRLPGLPHKESDSPIKCGSRRRT